MSLSFFRKKKVVASASSFFCFFKYFFRQEFKPIEKVSKVQKSAFLGCQVPDSTIDEVPHLGVACMANYLAKERAKNAEPFAAYLGSLVRQGALFYSSQTSAPWRTKRIKLCLSFRTIPWHSIFANLSFARRW